MLFQKTFSFVISSFLPHRVWNVWKSSIRIAIFQRATQRKEYYWPTTYRAGAAIVSTIAGNTCALENCFFQISSHCRAYVRIIYEKTKVQVLPRPLLGKQNTLAKAVYKRARKAVVIYIKARSFSRFTDNMKKLSVYNLNIWFRARKVTGTFEKRAPAA